MKERLMLLEFSSASLNFAVDLLRFSNDWAKREGYEDARIENTTDVYGRGGYRITVEEK